MNPLDFVLRRKRAYARLFRHENGQPVGDAAVVLADLKRFAGLPDAPVRASRVDGHTDLLATGIAIGRQEAVNRILAMTHTDEHAFFNLRETASDD